MKTIKKQDSHNFEAIPTREDLDVMMQEFLSKKRNKIKKIKRGESGIPEGQRNDNWGWMYLTRSQ